MRAIAGARKDGSAESEGPRGISESFVGEQVGKSIGLTGSGQDRLEKRYDG